MFHSSLHSCWDASQRKPFKIASDLDPSLFPKNWYGDQIKPMPLVYKKIGFRGSPQEICQISLKGYKYISKVNASGEFTLCILRKIKKTSCIKAIRRLDFDPYFCDVSGLKQLAEVFKKFKNSLSGLSIVIRRFTVRDELKQFSPSLARLNHLTIIRLEFANPQGMLLQDLEDLRKASMKLHFLKSVDIILSGNKELDKARGLFGNSKNTKKYRLHIYFMEKGPSQQEHEQNDESTKSVEKRQKFKVSKALKHLDLKLALKTNWASFFDGVDVSEGLQSFLKALPYIANPISFCLTFDKLQKPLIMVNEIANSLPQLPDLKFAFLEFTNTALGELELFTLAKGLVACKRMEHLTFKYLDKGPITVADVIQFIVIMAKFAVFPKFDLFFRKIFYPEWQSPEVRKKLDEIGNIQYVLTKQSLHVQKILSIG